MSFLESIANQIAYQSSKQHQLFLATVMGAVFVGLTGIIYSLYMQRDADVATLVPSICDPNDHMEKKGYRLMLRGRLQ